MDILDTQWLLWKTKADKEWKYILRLALMKNKQLCSGAERRCKLISKLLYEVKNISDELPEKKLSP